MKYIIVSGLMIIALIFIASCEKDPPNPFNNNPPVNGDTLSIFKPDPNSFEGLHAYIFKPTCANSGCHDGTFEPDFRTIYSSYNTMVSRPIIKNDPLGNFTFRVVPGSSAQSVLYNRITKDIDGQSGIMPLVLEPGNDWPAKKDEYIARIKNWIDAGAKDMFGNSPGTSNLAPQMQGVHGIASETLPRNDSGQGALRVKNDVTSLDIFVALTDDKTAQKDLSNVRLRFSTTPDAFDTAPDFQTQLLGVSQSFPGYFGAQVPYYYKININPKDFAGLGQTVFFRIYATDGDGKTAEIPTTSGAYYIKNYCSFTIVLP